MKNFILVALLLAPMASQGALLDDYIANQEKQEERRIIKEEIKRETRREAQEQSQRDAASRNWERALESKKRRA
jgi:hypothetical protein